MTTFSERLKSERKRLKQSQTSFAELCGITKQAQIMYEKEKLPQFAGYLESIAKAGADIGYIITGEKSGIILSDVEQELLSTFRQASPEVRAAAMAALKAGISMCVK